MLNRVCLYSVAPTLHMHFVQIYRICGIQRLNPYSGKSQVSVCAACQSPKLNINFVVDFLLYTIPHNERGGCLNLLTIALHQENGPPSIFKTAKASRKKKSFHRLFELDAPRSNKLDANDFRLFHLGVLASKRETLSFGQAHNALALIATIDFEIVESNVDSDGA